MVFRVGAVRASSIERLLDHLLTETEQRVPHEDELRLPDVDKQFDKWRGALLGRQTELGRDVASLLAHDKELKGLAKVAAKPSQGDRIREFLHGGTTPFRYPKRLVSMLLLAALSCSILFAFPHLLLAWDPDLAPTAATVGAALGWLGLMYIVLMGAFFADRRPFLSERLDPASFQQQRLQLLALKLAQRAGIAPPKVWIMDTAEINAEARGRPRGPSHVIVNAGLLKLSRSSVKAVLGHEIGHLAGDHLRTGSVPYVLAGPVHVLACHAISLTAWLSFRATHRREMYRRRVWESWSLGWHTVAVAPLGLALGFVSVLLTALALVLRSVAMALSRQVGLIRSRRQVVHAPC